MQFTEIKPWIETFDIFYSLGVDGFSVPLILLTTFFGVLVVIAGWEADPAARASVHGGFPDHGRADGRCLFRA